MNNINMHVIRPRRTLLSFKRALLTKLYILYFRIPRNTLCLPPSPPPLKFGTSHVQKTMVYAKFGGQTKSNMRNVKIENSCFSALHQERLIRADTFLFKNDYLLPKTYQCVSFQSGLSFCVILN